MEMKSTSMSISLPVISGIMEKKWEQEILAGPSFVIAATQVSTSMRRALSLAIPAPKDLSFPHLGAD